MIPTSPQPTRRRGSDGEDGRGVPQQHTDPAGTVVDPLRVQHVARGDAQEAGQLGEVIGRDGTRAQQRRRGEGQPRAVDPDGYQADGALLHDPRRIPRLAARGRPGVRRPERGVTRERQLALGGEDPDPVVGVRVRRLQQEGRLAEIRPARDRGQLRITQVVGVVHDRERVTGREPVGEHVDLRKAVHADSLSSLRARARRSAGRAGPATTHLPERGQRRHREGADDLDQLRVLEDPASPGGTRQQLPTAVVGQPLVQGRVDRPADRRPTGRRSTAPPGAARSREEEPTAISNSPASTAQRPSRCDQNANARSSSVDRDLASTRLAPASTLAKPFSSRTGRATSDSMSPT